MNASRTAIAAALIGVVGVALVVVAALEDETRALFAYAAAYAFAVSTAVGALLFVMIAHAAGATWFLAMRRWTIAIASTLPLLAVLGVPIVLRLHRLYPWAQDLGRFDAATAHAIAHQRAWASPTAFTVRAAVYFAVWIAVAELLRHASIAHDRRPDPALVRRQRVVSAAGLPFVALTLTFASFDWFMSLNAGWSSDMFGIYFFTGGFAAAIGVTAVAAAVACARAAPSSALREIRPDHFHALGRLLLVAVILWAYADFCQYLLVWIADLPHEVGFYLARREGTWRALSWGLAVGHFVLPWLFLLSRPLKRRPLALAAVGAWIVAVHGLDAIWMVVPALPGAPPRLLDFAAIAGVSGLAVAFAIVRARGVALLPLHDPDLPAALRYRSS